ncbi:hypothetical protein SAMN06297251_12714 [Fulvimarina manganoxydans]|uniref:Uncharacterized protein n=1 Tax=Fulvimarina manganoxydans TaxID=937218 RepID=A0A1W2EKD5_9HYPH|nr:hypothetical protein [Fulvimarina manganoxydans]SMD09962.1 hypothetical protein SAMN06297251_12714 [Fulvimarina manganoxydans]
MKPTIMPDEGQLTREEFLALGTKIIAGRGRPSPSPKAARSAEPGDGGPPAKPAQGGSSLLPSPRIEARLDDDEPVAKLRLVTPVTIAGTHHVWIAFREPTFAAIGALLAGHMSRPALAAAMTGLPDGFLGYLRYTDAERVMSLVHALAPDLPTG